MIINRKGIGGRKPNVTPDMFYAKLPETIKLNSEFDKISYRYGCTCTVCSHTWETLGWVLYDGHGCPICKRKGTKKFKPSDIQDILKSNNPTVEYIGGYTDCNHKATFKCLVCGHTWDTTAGNVLEGHGCPKCSHAKQGRDKRLTQDEFNSRLNDNITVLTPYSGQDARYQVQCNTCGRIYETSGASLLLGCGCELCRKSRGEVLIKQYLDKNGYENIPQYHFDDCKYKNTLSFDFYLPNDKICIEFDGLQHYKPIEFFGGIDSFIDEFNRDRVKDRYCLEHNIKLIRIHYSHIDEIDKVLQKEIEHGN